MLNHVERRHLPYTPEQVFGLVADVGRYAEFLPWMVSSQVTRHEGNAVWVEMEIGTDAVHRRFRSMGVLEPPGRIVITSEDPLFEHFEQFWTFAPAWDGATDVELRVRIAFRSGLLGRLMGRFTEEVATGMVGAFRHRARQIYGADGRPRVTGGPAGAARTNDAS